MTHGFSMELDTVFEGYDRKTEWFQPRIALLPDGRSLLTMTESALWGSDIFLGIYRSLSTDGGKHWSDPRLIPSLVMQELPDGFREAPADIVGQYHRPTGKVLYTGATAIYEPGEHGGCSTRNTHRRDVIYLSFDPVSDQWSDWRRLRMVDEDRFFWACAGCVERVHLEDGHVLQPIYFMDRDAVGENYWKSTFRVVVLKCRFDGSRMSIVDLGDELAVEEPRGLCEPSLVRFGEYYYLTLRNDVRAYVARSRDGMHFEDRVPWRFDDGEELGSYNTQQHWVPAPGRLFLTYTRRGADNDHVVRHRAPIFIAEVDVENLCVIRASERVAIPNTGAQMGNFGALAAGPDESWIVAHEDMQGDAQDPYNLELTEKRGADSRVYIARIRWNR